jgi:hypothetical protein
MRLKRLELLGRKTFMGGYQVASPKETAQKALPRADRGTLKATFPAPFMPPPAETVSSPEARP